MAVEAQTGVLTVPQSTYVNKVIDVSAAFKPARTGRPVRIEQFLDDTWIVVATGSQDSQGRFATSLTVTRPAIERYRATTEQLDAVSATSTAEQTVQIEPDPVAVGPDLELLTAAETNAIGVYDTTSGTLTFTADAPTSVEDIDPGSVLPIPPRDGLPSGALARVLTVNATPDGATRMTTEALDLPQVVENVPDGATDIAMAPIGAPVISDLAEGVTVDTAPAPNARTNRAEKTAPPRVSPEQSINLEGNPVRVRVTKTLTQQTGPVTLKAELSGSVAVTPVVELDLDMDWFTLKSYRIGAGLKTEETLKATVSAGAAKSWTVDLFRISMTRGGSIGPVPVWATFEGVVKATVSITGEIRATTQWRRTGTFMAGLRGDQSTDNYKPRPYESRLTTTTKLTDVTASGTADLSIVATAQLSLYTLAGPYASLGYQAAARIAGPINGPFTCTLSYGPTAAVGLAGSQALQRLTGKPLTMTEHKFNFPQSTVNLCPIDPTTEQPGSEGPWESVTNSGSNTCAIAQDGNAWCWGGNSQGEIGDGTTLFGGRPSPTRVLGNTKFTTLVTGGVTCGIATDQRAWCWGSFYDSKPAPLPGGGGFWTQLASGSGENICGVKADGSGWCWGGDNYYAQLGYGTSDTDDHPTPGRVLGDGWKQITTGHFHTCGLKTDGSAWCWGASDKGGLGNGGGVGFDPSASHAPKKIVGGGTYDNLATGFEHSCATKADNTLWCWGSNEYGQLGDNTTQNRFAPVQIAGAWSSVSAGVLSTCAIDTSARLFCWGYNEQGQSGTGAVGGYTTQPELVGLGWKSVTVGGYTTCGIRTGGGAYCWGSNEMGGQGTGNYQPSPVPVRVQDPA